MGLDSHEQRQGQRGEAFDNGAQHAGFRETEGKIEDAGGQER